MPTVTTPSMPADQDARIARQTSAALASLLATQGKAQLHIRAENNQESNKVSSETMPTERRWLSSQK